MREVTYEGDHMAPVFDAEMSKMSPEQRVAMASLNVEAKKRADQKLKEKEMEEIEIAATTPTAFFDFLDENGEGVDLNAEEMAAACADRVTTNYLRYTQAALADDFHRIFANEIMALRDAGQKEYAHDDSSPFANFERGAKDMGIDRKQVLWVYAMKHKDGIAAHLKGQVSQREDVRGRVNDLIVYLLLLRGILNEEAGNTGDFGLGKL